MKGIVKGHLALYALLVASSAFAGVCERTAPLRDFLVDRFGKPCENITASDLLKVRRIALPATGITSLRADDFDGFSNLRTLNLKRNHILELPPAIFASLHALRELVILGNELRTLPDDFLVGNERLERLHFFQNHFTRIPEVVLQRIHSLTNLQLLDVDADMDTDQRELLDQWFPLGGNVLVNYNARQ